MKKHPKPPTRKRVPGSSPVLAPPPDIDDITNLSRLADLILLMPHAYAKLDADKRASFYARRDLSEVYQELVLSTVDVLFDQIYPPSDERWRGSYLLALEAALQDLADPQRKALAKLISLFEASVARNHLPR